VLDIEAQYAQRADIQRQIGDIQRYVLSVGGSSDPSLGVPGLLTWITDSARQAQVQVQKITPRETTARSTLDEHVVDLTVEGEFAPLLQFVSRLEAWSGNLWFGRLQMGSARKDGENLTSKLSLIIFTDRGDSSG
jgi:hypothetical protein